MVDEGGSVSEELREGEKESVASATLGRPPAGGELLGVSEDLRTGAAGGDGDSADVLPYLLDHHFVEVGILQARTPGEPAIPARLPQGPKSRRRNCGK